MVDGWKLREKPSEMKTRSLVALVCAILFLANATLLGSHLKHQRMTGMT